MQGPISLTSSAFFARLFDSDIAGEHADAVEETLRELPLSDALFRKPLATAGDTISAIVRYRTSLHSYSDALLGYNPRDASSVTSATSQSLLRMSDMAAQLHPDLVHSSAEINIAQMLIQYERACAIMQVSNCALFHLPIIRKKLCGLYELGMDRVKVEMPQFYPLLFKLDAEASRHTEFYERKRRRQKTASYHRTVSKSTEKQPKQKCRKKDGDLDERWVPSSISIDLCGLRAVSECLSGSITLPEPRASGSQRDSVFLMFDHLITRHILWPVASKAKPAPKRKARSGKPKEIDARDYSCIILLGQILHVLTGFTGTEGILLSPFIGEALANPRSLLGDHLYDHAIATLKALQESTDVLEPIYTSVEDFISTPDCQITVEVWKSLEQELFRCFLSYDTGHALTLSEFRKMDRSLSISLMTPEPATAIQPEHAAPKKAGRKVVLNSRRRAAAAVVLALREAALHQAGMPNLGTPMYQQAISGQNPKINPDHVNALRRSNAATKLFTSRLPPEALSLPFGLCNALVWVGFGFCITTDAFTAAVAQSHESGTLAWECKEDCLTTFTAALEENRRKLRNIPRNPKDKTDYEQGGDPERSDILKLCDVKAFGQPTAYMKLYSGKHNLATKLEGYWHKDIVDLWATILHMKEENALMNWLQFQHSLPEKLAAPKQKPTRSVLGFSSLNLSTAQLANYLVISGFLAAPTVKDIGSWLYNYKNAGSRVCLGALGFDLGSERLITEAFKCVYEHFRSNMSDEIKAAISFDPMCMEHLLCKGPRFMSFFGRDLVEDALADISKRDERVKEWPMGSVVDEEFLPCPIDGLFVS